MSHLVIAKGEASLEGNGGTAQWDEEDDWTDPKAWIKANPNLGGGCPKMENLEMLCRQAQDMPSAENSIKRLRLNIWTEQINRWIKMAIWNNKNANPFNEMPLFKRLNDLQPGWPRQQATTYTA